MISRLVLIACGFISVGLGIAGIFLPVLPTTPFLILAALCFSKSSPRFHAWLLDHPRLGPYVRDWQTHRVIRPRVKAMAVTLIATSGVWSGYLLADHALPLRLLVAAILAGAATFILSQKSRPTQ